MVKNLRKHQTALPQCLAATSHALPRSRFSRPIRKGPIKSYRDLILIILSAIIKAQQKASLTRSGKRLRDIVLSSESRAKALLGTLQGMALTSSRSESRLEAGPRGTESWASPT